MITKRLKSGFCQKLLSSTDSPIGFVDVGSGGELKYPWDLLPKERLKKFDFEPTNETGNGLPHCISNKSGKAKFFIAKDERSSSLHEPSHEFVNRFGLDNTLTAKTVEVELITLDQALEGKYGQIDLMDFNVEGHDFQALEGAGKLLSQGFVKLIKIEFELTEVWRGQKWFSDIDKFLRERKFDLANIEIEYGKPVKVRGIVHRGEPVWGKAYYVPNLDYWKEQLSAKNGKDKVTKAVVLYTLCDLPGRAIDLIDLAEHLSQSSKEEVEELRKDIFATYRFEMLEAGGEEIKKLFLLPFKIIKRLTR